MMSIFRPNRVASDSDDSSSSDDERILPPGTPYLTKINGKLVWARKKVPKPVNPVQDLLGEAFGSRAVIVRKRSKSLERPVKKVLIGNVPVVHQVAHSAPLPQQPFPTVMPPMAHYTHHPPQFLLQPVPQPMPQPMPQPVPQPTQLPQLYIPQPPPVPAPLFVQQSPTEKEKEQLKIFDAHFNKIVKPKPVRVTSASSEESQEKTQDKPQEKAQEKVTEETTTKVKIAITRHVCGDCGRLRSRKYHHDHPLKLGEIPEVAFCRKCQKDASSTSESSESEGAYKSKKKRKLKKKKKTKKVKAPRKKSTESSDDEDDDESSDSPEPEPPKKPKPDGPKPVPPKKSTAKKVISEDYIVVEEELSDGERQPRGRSHSRVSRGSDGPRRPLSPLASQLSAPRTRSQSHARPSRRDFQENIPHPIEVHEAFKGTVRPRSPHIQYRYVEAVPSQASLERDEPTYSRRAPGQFVDEVYEKPISPKRSHHEDRGRERASSSKAYSVEEPESVTKSHRARVEDYQEDASIRDSQYDTFEVREASSRGPPSRENSFEVPDTMSSMRFSEARRRRRRERAPPGMADFRPWEEPHVIHPESDDEVVVVTETFEYRKKKQDQDEEERRRQEYIDRATLSPRTNYQFSPEEAARYYHDDWSRAEPEFVIPSLVGKPYQPYQPAKAKKGYRRDRHPDSEVTESEASYEYGISDTYPPSRAPSPPSTIFPNKINDFSGLKHTDWGDEPPYPQSSGSEHASRQGKVVHMPHIDVARRDRSNSNARYGVDGNPERALVVSPRHSSDRNHDSYYDYSESDVTERQHRDESDDFSVSNMTELERQAEAESRHVTFRDTPSMRSLRDEWGISEGHSQRSRSEHDGRDGGGGWDDSGGNSGGNGGWNSGENNGGAW